MKLRSLAPVLLGGALLAPLTALPAATPTPDAPAGGVEAPSTPAPILDRSLVPERGRVSPAAPFASARARFDVQVDGETVHFTTRSLLILPGTSVSIRAPGDALLRHATGTVTVRAPGDWRWEAPEEPGVYALRIERPDADVVNLVAFVLHPRSRLRDGALGSYRIGSYRETPLRGLATYLPPEGFIEVDEADEDIRVSPHVTLGEILCKQPGDPRFATFTPALLDKLEIVLEGVNDHGIEAGALTVMSGFRTPWYNRSIGNTTDYSRHLWGDAADIYIDVDGNGEMDDLNDDGRSDLADARALADIVERVRASDPEPYVPGGIGLYRRNAVRGPFVHVDARGEPARW